MPAVTVIAGPAAGTSAQLRRGAWGLLLLAVIATLHLRGELPSASPPPLLQLLPLARPSSTVAHQLLAQPIRGAGSQVAATAAMPARRRRRLSSPIPFVPCACSNPVAAHGWSEHMQLDCAVLEDGTPDGARALSRRQMEMEGLWSAADYINVEGQRALLAELRSFPFQDYMHGTLLRSCQEFGQPFTFCARCIPLPPGPKAVALTGSHQPHVPAPAPPVDRRRGSGTCTTRGGAAGVNGLSSRHRDLNAQLSLITPRVGRRCGGAYRRGVSPSAREAGAAAGGGRASGAGPQPRAGQPIRTGARHPRTHRWGLLPSVAPFLSPCACLLPPWCPLRLTRTCAFVRHRLLCLAHHHHRHHQTMRTRSAS